MAHVIVKYIEDYGEIEELFLEGTYNRVSWDGLSLRVGNKYIRTHQFFEDHISRTGEGYMGGATDIQYLKIDDKVYIGDT